MSNPQLARARGRTTAWVLYRDTPIEERATPEEIRATFAHWQRRAARAAAGLRGDIPGCEVAVNVYHGIGAGGLRALIPCGAGVASGYHRCHLHGGPTIEEAGRPPLLRRLWRRLRR